MNNRATRLVSQHHKWSGYNRNQPGVCCNIGTKPGSCVQKSKWGNFRRALMKKCLCTHRDS